MSITATDWTIDSSTKVIAYIGDDHVGVSPSYATVIEFHRWLQDLADDAVASGDDELDITDLDPSRRSTDNIITLINGYTISATETEHLYDGSIIQSDGDDVWDGIVNFGNSDVQIQIFQNGTVLADDWWNYDGGGLNADSTAGISHRFMIKVRTGGTDIDTRRLLGTSRTFGKTYSSFAINATARGNNVLALSDAIDLNNTTAIATVAAWNTITNESEGYIGIDVNNDGTPEYYFSEWNRDGYTINQLYERIKWLTRDGSTSELYGISGELFRGITHEIDIDTNSGTFSTHEPVSWSGGTGQMLAINSVTAGTKMWIQRLTGNAPTDGQTITGGTSGASCAMNTTIVDRSATISKPFIGTSTGSALIGSYGVGVEVADLTSVDKVTDLTNTVINPPNYVQNVVSGLISGEDRILVAPWDGVSLDVNGDPAINKSQFALNSGLTSNNITSVTVKTLIPSDTPNTGYIRVTDNNGFERRLHYTSWSGYVFTIDTTDGNEDFGTVQAASNNKVYIAYIDELASGTTASFTSVQSGSRDLVVIVRDGGTTPIKQFISAWSQTNSAGSISVIRTTDI